MRSFSSTFALALPILGSASPLQARQAVDSLTSGAAPIAKSYIIEYSSNKVRARDGVAADEDIKIVKDFDSSIFSGASIETSVYNIDSLKEFGDIVNVWLNELVQLEPVEPLGFSDDAAAADYTTHNATGVSKLHAAGIFGEGVIVGVVDTGTWYDHPALGGGFGPGFKVAGGYDFVGNGFWPSEGEKEPDSDPKDQLGHGTHVAGIIAGKTDFWTGVAPEATIYSYKVFAQVDSVDTATLIESFLAAYEDGVDIITSSIGGANGWANNAWAEVASRIVEEGVVVTISAGNSGAAGPFFGSSGSSGKNVVAVASVETELFPASPFLAKFSLDGLTNETKVGYLPSTYYFPSSIVDWPIVALNFDTSAPADGCTPYPPGTRRLDGVIPLVRRGTCNFTVKQQNLAALGAEYIFIYNDARPLVTPSTTDSDTLIAMITAGAGKAIIDTILAGGNVTASFSINPEEVIGLEYPAGGRPNTFTSWGGLYDLQIKPDIAAPGGQIFSTYLDNTFALLSGTSMACPYVAGVAALYISVHGGRSVHGKGFAKTLHQRMISSGTALPWSDGTATNYGYAASVAQVGNGLIDAFKVVNYATQLDFEKIALNDTRYFSRYHDIVVTNNGDKDSVTYTFSTQVGAGVEILGWFGQSRVKSFTELTPKSLVPQITLPKSFTLKPGASKSVSINFKNPDSLGWNSSALPVYSGKIVVSGNNGEQLSVPYMGLAADLRKVVDPIYRAGYPFSVSTWDNLDIQEKSSYTFNLGVDEQDFPKIYSKIIWGSREVRWDIFEAGWTERQWSYPPVPGQKGYVGPATCWVGAGQVSYFDPGFYDPDQTWTYPDTDVYRNAMTTAVQNQYWWFGKLGNGSQIENGNYTMRFATLKPFGDPTHADNWSVFKTPQITVLGKY